MKFDHQTMWNKDGASGEFTGVKGGAGTTKAFFAGADDKDGTNAKFFAQADGNIFHAAIGSQGMRLQRVAPLGSISGGGVTKISGNDTWSVFAEIRSSDPAGTTTETSTVFSGAVMRKFSEDKLTLYGRYVAEQTIGTGSADHRIIIEVYQGTSLINSSTSTYSTVGSGDDISQEVDISSVSINYPMLVHVSLEVEVTGGGGSTDNGEMKLFSDAVLKTETG